MASSQKENLDNKNFLRPADLTAIYGISRATIFRWMSDGKLPEPKRLSPRVIGWNRAVLDDIFLK